MCSRLVAVTNIWYDITTHLTEICLFVQMVDYFYCKEHLFIVSELLRYLKHFFIVYARSLDSIHVGLSMCVCSVRENLYEFGKYIRESGEPEYFTIPRLKKIMKQVVHS